MEKITLQGEKIPDEVSGIIPPETVSFYKIMPFKKKGNVLHVAMVEPQDITALEALKFIAQRYKLQIKIYQITQNDFNQAFKQYGDIEEEAEEVLGALEEQAKKEKATLGDQETKEEKLKRIAQEAPISKMVAVILRHAIEGRASDIHIEPEEKKLRVRFRIDGVLQTGLTLPKRIHPAVVSRIKILSNLKIDIKRKPQDGRFRANIDGKKIDFRVSTFPTEHGEKAVLRVLDPDVGIQELKDLGLQGRNSKLVEQAIKEPYGMILVTGPTGSGKSTTLYAILKILNKEGVNIVTLEDPIEYWIPGISQSQVRPDIGYTFANGLRSVLRQDPDIIMVGEIRDEETAELAVHAALTGHLLLSTLHTNSAVGTVPRLADMGVAPFLLSSSLNLIIAQRLAKRIKTKSDKPIMEEELAQIKKEWDNIPEEEKKRTGVETFPQTIYQPKKMKGRIGLFETLDITPEMEKIIAGKLTKSRIREAAQEQGVISMRQDGIIKIIQGSTSLEEVMRVT